MIENIDDDKHELGLILSEVNNNIISILAKTQSQIGISSIMQDLDLIDKSLSEVPIHVLNVRALILTISYQK